MDNNNQSITNRIKTVLKNPKIWQFALAALVIAIISLCFFHPDAVEGNKLMQSDMLQGQANGQEAKAFEEATGETTRWTNSLFGGMPTFQISPSYPSNGLFDWITTVYGLGLPSPSNLIFMMMIGFMILMFAMNVKWYYGLIGAVAWGFSTYFIIIIGAGHIWKFVTLSYIPPTIAGIVLCYRGKYLAGGALAALFAMMQIASNHVQMTYYFLFVILGFVIVYLVDAVKTKQIIGWVKATGVLACSGVLALAANSPSLYNTYEYSKETMRGGHSELTKSDDGVATTNGLDRSYITQYSYGNVETFSLLIPNIKGGASAKPEHGGMAPLSLSDLPDAQKMKEAGSIDDMEMQYLSYVSQYFGEPEGTNGPIYVGAVICALFVLGCFVIKGPMKWALLILTVLSILLALGRNCQWLTDLFIDYVPMYNKFRTVESILVIAEFTMPLLAILTLQQLLTTKDWWAKYKTALLISFGSLGLICLAGIVFPSIFGSVITPQDEETSQMIVSQLTAQGYPADVATSFSLNNPRIFAAVTNLRQEMISSDSLRSLFFLAATFIFIYLLGVKKIQAKWTVAAIGVLLLADLYTVNKRYVNHDSFCSEQVSMSDPFAPTATDKAILADTAINYRVFDVDNFWRPNPSYHHKMLGGYHAAKLTRYQDIIDCHISHFLYGGASETDMNVINMLNAKYIVAKGQVVNNPDAMGNAWLVEGVTFVAGADEEMDGLEKIDVKHQAVADKKFKGILAEKATVSPTDTIYEVTYAPNKLTYHVETQTGGIAVFSEVYFPWGWNAEIDGKKAEIGRVNYILRAMNVPAGKHTIVMTFDPQSIHTTTYIATTAVVIIYILVLAAIVLSIVKVNRKE